MTENSYTHELKEAWEAKLDDLVDWFPSETVDEETTRDGFEQLIGAAVGQSHDEWELHTPCPDCGSTVLFRWVSIPELTRHENDCVEYQDGSNCSTMFAWQCAECDTALTVSPAAIVTPGAPGDIDWEQTTELEALEQVLHEHLPDADWTPGSACSLCESNYIGESPLEAYTGDVDGDHFVQDHFGERITTTEYWCDGCGETLSQNLGGSLSESLTM